MDMKAIIYYAVAAADDHRDSIGDINLTALEEDVRIEFDIEDEDFDENDVSFTIWHALNSRGMLPPL